MRKVSWVEPIRCDDFVGTERRLPGNVASFDTLRSIECMGPLPLRICKSDREPGRKTGIGKDGGEMQERCPGWDRITETQDGETDPLEERATSL
jgi:hypothetical protein